MKQITSDSYPQLGWGTEVLESSSECSGEGVGDKVLLRVFDGVHVSKWLVNGSLEPPLDVTFDKIVTDSNTPAFSVQRDLKVVANFG